MRFVGDGTSRLARGAWVLVLVWACGLEGLPLGAEELTLERAVAIALEHNRQLAVAAAGVEVAEAGLAEVATAYRPKVDLAGGLLYTDNPVMVFSSLLGQESFGAENFALDNLNRPDPLADWTARLSVSQTLWAGGRVARARDAAAAGVAAATADEEHTRQVVVHQTIERYTSAVAAAAGVEVVKKALAAAEATVLLTTDLFDSGLVVEADVLQARVRESALREQLLQAQAGAAIARAALGLVLGRRLETAESLPALLVPPAADETPLATLLAEAPGRRPDLEAMAKQQQAAELQVAMAAAERRPKAGVGAAYETHAEDFFGADGDNFSINLGLTVSLFDGGVARERRRQAEARARQAEEGRLLLADAVGLEVERAWHELGAARQRHELARSAIALAERSRAITLDRYQEGLARLPELIDAEADLAEARQRELAAIRDLLHARASLDLATGQL